MKMYSSMSDGQIVSLRFINENDASVLMQLNNDAEISKYVVGNPKQVTLQEQMQWMEKIKSEKNTKRFIVEYSNEPVGTVIISNIDLLNSSANLNIKLLSCARGKGIGKNSVRLALKYCFDELGLFCITAHVLSYNTPSLALFESCGFTREGILRSRVVKNSERFDLISFSFIRSDLQLS